MHRYVPLFVLTMMVFSNVLLGNTPKIEPGVSKELAVWRKKHYSDVRYKLDLKLEKMSPTLKGTIQVKVRVAGTRVVGDAAVGGSGDADRQGRGAFAGVPIVLDWRKIVGHEGTSKVSNVRLNGISVTPVEVYEHLVFSEGVVDGENVIQLDFESPILKSGSAITRYIDGEDGSEYIYSLFVPSDASTAFPVFDQPDMKARFKLTVEIVGRDRPTDWTIVSNEKGAAGFDSTWSTIWNFDETEPISTYVFAFAAGPFAEFQDESQRPVSSFPLAEQSALGRKTAFAPNRRVPASPGPPVTDPPPNRVFVRKSQAEEFKPHAEEVFRLNREAIKYFEGYFDFKFPFSKYDVVLIPEFPFGGMEHAGATFLRERSVIFPTEPTSNDYISRASVIFHEAAHQWFGDTVTMEWFDDLWLKEGFATFMAYKAMDEILPEYNAWKVFYERTKTSAYLTDVTKGTTPIYQEISNLNSAKSAYGNIVYQKAPSFLKQAEYYFGEGEFRTAVRAFLKKHDYANAAWSDLVKEFEAVECTGDRSWELQVDEKGRKGVLQKCIRESIKKADLKEWADSWIKGAGVSVVRVKQQKRPDRGDLDFDFYVNQENAIGGKNIPPQRLALLKRHESGDGVQYLALNRNEKSIIYKSFPLGFVNVDPTKVNNKSPLFIFPNYDDYGYGIFLLDGKSRNYVLKNIQNEKDAFLRSMMWGALWDSVRFAEMDPAEYIELAIKHMGVETDQTTISSILGRVRTAHTYYLSDKQRRLFAPKLEKMMVFSMAGSRTDGELLTYYRAFLGVAESPGSVKFLASLGLGDTKQGGILLFESGGQELHRRLVKLLRPKDYFDIAEKLAGLGDKNAPAVLTKLEKENTDDASKRDAYAAKAAFATAENKKRYFDDFVNNKEISESWIEAAFGTWNDPSHEKLTLPYLKRALAELPNLKRDRKIFFVNGWLAAFLGGQRSKEALNTVNVFLKDNQNLDPDLQRKILERVDGLERAVKIREKYGKN